MSEQELVKRCLYEIFQQNGYLEPQQLLQRDFETIGQRIAEKTGILISISTLKRLLKGDFARLPQIATLNALSTYLGYKNWQDYRSVHQSHGLNPNGKNQIRKGKIPRVLLFSSILGLLLLWIIASHTRLKHSNIPFEPAEFSVKKVTENDLPNTVVFHYNIDGIDADSFFIQQSWDKNRRVRVFKSHYTLTDIYYEPGYHTAKLMANEQIIKTLEVSIPTKDWFFYAKRQFPRGFPHYIYPDQYLGEGKLGLNEASLKEQGINPQTPNNYVYTYFPQKWPVHSDKFSLSARVRVKELHQHPCPYLMVEVFCQKNFMYFVSMPPGCASECKLQFGDLILNGKTSDLSNLGAKVTDWVDVLLEVRNRQVRIFFNQKEVFSGQYHESSKLITGIGFISNGLCEVEQVSLKGLDGQVFYEQDFRTSQ